MSDNTFFKAVEDHAPLLLTVYGAISITAVGVATAFATLRTKSKVEQMRNDVEGMSEEEAKAIRRKAYTSIGLTWLIPAGIAVTGTLATVGAYKSSTETKLLATAGAGAIGKKVYDDHKEKKEQPKLEDKSMPNTNYGNVDLIFDSMTGNAFRMDKKKIDNAIKILNNNRPGKDITLAEFYELIGECQGAFVGDLIFWDVHDQIEYYSNSVGIGVEPSSCMNEKGEETPCWEITYYNYSVKEI